MQQNDSTKIDSFFDAQARDIKEVNFLYLNLVRNAALHNPAAASLHYGCSKEFLEQIRESSVSDLMKMADNVVPVFRLEVKSLSDLTPEGRIKTLLAHFAERRNA